MGESVVLGAGFGGRYFAAAIEAPCLSRSNGFDLNLNLDGLLDEIRRIRPRYVFNFASQSMVGESWVTPADWMRTNVLAQTRLIQGLAQLDFLDKYVHFTTPEVYGSTEGWIAESWNFAPSTPYAVSRASGDWITKLWFEQYGFPAVFTRAANIYGEAQQPYRIIPKTILFGLMGRKLPLHGGGRSIRAFVHMDDVVAAIKLIVNAGSIGDSYHISPHDAISIRDLVTTIEGLIGVENISFDAGDRPGKDQAYLLNSSKLNALGWSPQVELRAGLARVVNWVRENFNTLSQSPVDYSHRQ